MYRSRPVAARPKSVVHAFHNGRVLEALEQLQTVVVDCADTPVWSLPDDEVLACLSGVVRVEQALAAARLHLIRQAEARDLAAAQCATSTVGWLREHLRVSVPTARRWVELARTLDQRPDLDSAVIAGEVNTEQAAVIGSCLTGLPAETGAEAASKAETMLIDWAADFDPHALRKLGSRILAHVAPEVAERADAQALARQQARAEAGRGFTLSPVGDGRVRLTGWLDTEAAATVTAAIDPLGGPLPGDERTAGQRRADALVEVCRLALSTTELPVNGGDRPQLTLTIDFERLRAQIGAGLLDTGERLTPAQVRRLACDAQLLPAVLGDAGQVLDLGQSRRLITGAVRRALVLRDGGCAFPACDRPSRWCDGHHIRSWIDGGPTSLANSVLLCGFHHRLIHHSDWTIRLAPDGRPEFLPPAHLDPARRPRRNAYHHRI